MPEPRVPSGVIIRSAGVELPERVVTSAEIERRAQISERFGHPPGWLERTSGVTERRWAEGDVQPSQLAAAAARDALKRAGLRADSVDTVLFCGITRDFMEPAVANVVAEAVGARSARCFDLSNACNGLADGLDVADSLVRTGKAHRVLVTTGERASLCVHWRPRDEAELRLAVASMMVGDGGGALLVEASADPGRGLVGRAFRSDPTQWRIATGGRFRPSQACKECGSVLEMPFVCDGRELFRAGFALVPPTFEAAMQLSGWAYDELDLVFCHEASRRFVEHGTREMGDRPHPGPKLWSTVGRFGNTSTLSLALGIAEALEAGALHEGARVLLLAGAAGVSAAAVTLVW